MWYKKIDRGKSFNMESDENMKRGAKKDGKELKDKAGWAHEEGTVKHSEEVKRVHRQGVDKRLAAKFPPQKEN